MQGQAEEDVEVVSFHCIAYSRSLCEHFFHHYTSCVLVQVDRQFCIIIRPGTLIKRPALYQFTKDDFFQSD